MAASKFKSTAKRIWSRNRRYILERFLSETYSLTPLEEYAERGGLPVRQLAPAEKVAGAPPIFIRDDELCDISGYDGTCLSPEISLFEFENVTTVGRTEFILSGENALYPSVIDPESDAFMMELENRGSVDISSGKVTIFPRAAHLNVASAISLLGQCNGNYAHWITEVLARFVMIDDIPELTGAPLLVDHPVHEKLQDALDFLNVSRREIINVLPYQKVKVGKLFYVSPPSMTPPETRLFFETGKLADPRPEQFHFSKVALAKLRERAVAMARDCLIGPKTEAPWSELPAPKNRKIFLRREAWSTGNGRLLRNTEDVAVALNEFGFESVNIADFSFEGQVLTVADTEIAVSAIGAALSNFVFRDPGCTVIIISPHYKDATFFYFANLMAALGHQLIFVLGPQTRHGNGSIYNRDFRVSIRLLRYAVHKSMEISHKKKVKYL